MSLYYRCGGITVWIGQSLIAARRHASVFQQLQPLLHEVDTHSPRVAMPQPSALGVCSIVVLSFLRFGVAFVPPAQNQALQLKVPAAVHNVIQRDDSSTITTLLQGTSSSASSSSSSGSTSTSTSSTSNTSTSISTSSHDAKESFLRNLERKRAGEAIPSALLDADLARLWSSTTTPSTATTAVDDLESWKGKWRICHAPHIDTLGGLMLTKFPSVEYNFQSSDGRMVSHSRYESKVFGSGWFNADGRVVSLKQQQEIKPRADDSSVVRRKDEEVVKVRSIFLGTASTAVQLLFSFDARSWNTAGRFSVPSGNRAVECACMSAIVPGYLACDLVSTRRSGVTHQHRRSLPRSLYGSLRPHKCFLY